MPYAVLRALGLVSVLSAIGAVAACRGEVISLGSQTTSATSSQTNCAGPDGCNVPGCPAGLPSLGDPCSAPGATCWYGDGPCNLSFQCEDACLGGGACSGGAVLGAGDAFCTPGAVPCLQALDGDVCAFPGESCDQGDGCSGVILECTPDHHWVGTWYTSFCCGTDCCEPTCPATIPEPGAGCDPCADGPSCSYVVDTGACGVQTLGASCDAASAAWLVEVPECPP
ncbi:MAG: hypothetical protein HY908_16245 [Myxococcales bacterium]|nr:hypothetical protein [Myxococcales bacterium]